MSDDNKRIFNEFDKKRKEISELRNTLNQVNEDKEKWFDEKDKTGREIHKLVSEIKNIKNKRDELTRKVKDFKQHKDKIVQEIKSSITKSRKLNQEKIEFFRKHNIKGDPIRIKKQIEAIETKIETEVIPFNQEQKLMKKIKELKANFSEFGELNKVMEKMSGISGNIDALKTQEKELKKGIRKTAKDSQREHEKILEISKKIDELRLLEKQQFDKFVAFKKQFTEINNKLKDLLPEMGELKGTVNNIRTKKKKDKELREKLSLNEKKSRVDEKIKKGEKLTTEDLLVFQNK